MERLTRGSVIVKYDTDLTGAWSSLAEAMKAIREHHFVVDDPKEAGYFEFYLVIGDAGNHVGSSSTQGKIGLYDEDGDRVVYGYKVVDLGHVLKEVP